jgi:acetolactate synthase-1/2/3 large subunit
VSIVATGFGDRSTGGGAFVVGEDGVERLDWLASTGLAVEPGGRRVARLLRGTTAEGDGGELLVSDERGVVTYRRVDELSDPHDVLWHDGRLVVVASSANAILWLDDAGRLVRRWTADGTGDAWHLNCLEVDGDRLLCCAFGRFTTHRGWTAPGATDGAGIVFDVASGETVIGGLTNPHHPRRLDGRWLVCDSGKGGLAVYDHQTGERLADVALGGFSRGLAYDDDLVYVGINPDRKAPAVGTAEVVALGRVDLQERWRTSLPCREVYDVVAVPDPLVEGLRRGFRTNAARTADDDQLDLFRAAGITPVRLWATGDPLPPEACRTELALLDVPPAMRPGKAVPVQWTLRNLGGAALTSAGVHPVHLSWRWYGLDGGEMLAEGDRVLLDNTVVPGADASGTALVTAPPGDGPLQLRASLVQELVHWFDDVEPANGFRALVERLPG